MRVETQPSGPPSGWIPALFTRDNPFTGPTKGIYMSDDQDKTAEQLATEISNPQIAQVDPTEDGSQSSSSAQETKDEMILGKFKSQDELVRGYQELEHKLRTTRPEVSQPRVSQPVTPSPIETIFDFDNETVVGISSIVDRRVQEKLEQERALEFARKHKDELADPLLRGAVLIEIQEANGRGEYLDQETALANAKRALESRLSPKVEEASKESFKQGQDLSRKKEQAGAIGDTSVKTPAVDPENLTAEEYAAYYNLERV